MKTCCVVVSLCAIFVASNSAVADDYSTAANALASPIHKSLEDSLKAYEDPATMLRVEMARQRLKLIPSRSKLSSVQTNALPHLDSCNASLKELRRLNQNMPDIEGIVKRGINAIPAVTRTDKERRELTALQQQSDQQAVNDLAGKVIIEGGKLIADAWNASTERDNYRKSYQAARRVARDLESFAERQCTGRKPTGTYGIGIDYRRDVDEIVVLGTKANGPAANAGIQQGDIITSVDDVPLVRRSEIGDVFLDEAVMATLRGEFDTTVKVSFIRDHEKKTVRVKRRFFIEDNPILSVDLNGSWDATFTQDVLNLQNVAGEELTNCTLVVTLEGTHLSKPAMDRHVHYIERWPAGDRRVAVYRSSSAPGLARDESVDFVERVVINVYSDQYQTSIDYKYADTTELEKDIERYFADPKSPQRITLSFSPNNVFLNGGVSIRHDGEFSRIPDADMTVTLSEGLRRDETFTWTTKIGKKWDAGYLGSQSLRRDQFNGMTPSKIEVKLRFPGTSKWYTFDKYLWSE